MDFLQFSLFFIALIVGYVLVHIRLARFEEHLRQLSGIRSLDDRLRSIVELVEKVRLERVESQLHTLHEDLEDLREATGSVQEAVVNLPPPAVAAAGDAPPVEAAPREPSAGERIRGLVETRLIQLGYTNLVLLTDLRGVPTDGDVEVQVECEKQHMPVKGRVLLRNGAIRDVAMQSIATMFP